MASPSSASSVPPATWLWKGKRVHAVDSVVKRNELFALWTEGKLSGIFNMPTLVRGICRSASCSWLLTDTDTAAHRMCIVRAQTT